MEQATATGIEVDLFGDGHGAYADAFAAGTLFCRPGEHIEVRFCAMSAYRSRCLLEQVPVTSRSNIASAACCLACDKT